MLSAYLPVLMILLTAGIIAVAMFTLTSVLGPKNMTAEKALPYESGSPSDGARHIKLSVKFYVTAMLFVVFDVEAVFLYPWAPLVKSLGWLGMVEMIAFLGVLGVCLLYVWKKGALEWEK